MSHSLFNISHSLLKANNKWKRANQRFPNCPTFFSALTLSPLFSTCHADHCAHVIDYCEDLILKYKEDNDLDDLSKIVLIELVITQQCFYNITAACLYQEGEITHD